MGALAAPPDPELEAVLGRDGAQRLRAELAARAWRWAAAVGAGNALEAATVSAALAALHGHAGPVLLAAPDVPRLDERAARDALEDLAAGCDVVVGVTHDARPYLIATPCVDAELLELVAGSFAGGVLAAFSERGLRLGVLRHERRLATAADARALAIDPLAPAGLAALVRGRCAGRHAGSLGGMEYEREQEEAAAEDVRRSLGGEAGDEVDYIERDSRPAGISDEAWRPVQEAGGGEAEGYEEAEAELIERAENAHGPSPLKDAERTPEEPEALDQEYGEADAEHTSEDEPGESDR